MPKPLYQRLDPKKSEIRVLVVRPARRRDSRIRCNLIHVDLDAMSEAPFSFHEAVSYTWGDMSDTKRVDLERHNFSITRNFHGLLERLRSKRAQGYYWVNAIYIDKQDIPERCHQVQLMKAIYEHAEQVLIWLGPASADSDIAMDVVDEITDTESPIDSTENELTSLQRYPAQLQTSLKNPDDQHKW